MAQEIHQDVIDLATVSLMERQRAEAEAIRAFTEECKLYAVIPPGALAPHSESAPQLVDPPPGAPLDETSRLEVGLLESACATARRQSEYRQARLDESSSEVNILRAELNAGRAIRESEIALRYEAEALLGAQSSLFAEFQSKAKIEIGQAHAALSDVERSWFALYSELEESKSAARRLEANFEAQTTALAALELALHSTVEREGERQREVDRNLAEIRRLLETARHERDESRAKSARQAETLAATRASLHAARERSDRLVAELSILKVRATRAELKVSELEARLSKRERPFTTQPTGTV